MSIGYQESANQATIILEEEATLGQAEEFRMILIKSIINTDQVNIDMSNVKDMDLSCLQLLCSAHRSALRMKKRVVLSGDLPEVYKKAVQDSGYERTIGCHLDCNSSCLWMNK